MLPVMLRVEDRLCVVVGGGAVGRRKAHTLRECGARVRVVCPDEKPADLTDPGVEWITAAYHPGYLDGAVLALAAADAAVNRQVVDDARARGIWVNSATEPERGDVLLPATFQRGDLTVAVSTRGKAPGLAREVCQLLDQQLGKGVEKWLELVAELRPLVLEQIADEDKRREILRNLCHSEWLQRLEHEGEAHVRLAMWRLLEAVAGPPAGTV